MTNPIEIYQSPTGETEVEVRFDNETVWLSLQQMADIFGRDKSVISRHIKKVFDEEELDKNSTVAKNATVQIEGQREVVREIEYFNLDVIISVGYRVNSKAGTAFRRWATARLKDYLLKGYAINQKRLAENAFELEQALSLIQKTAQSTSLTLESGRGLIDVVSRYTQTFLWLQQYDEGLLSEPKGEMGGIIPSIDEARQSLATLKADLIAKGEATELFAKERGDGLPAILGNLQQTVFGEPAYPSIEEKAGHLLYFVIKNHPFADGNKRSGAFLFVDFLYKNGRLFNKNGEPIINDTGLTALALLIAESDPDNKDTLIKLIVHMLQYR